MNATYTLMAALWLAIAVGTPHPSNATEGVPVGHGQRGAIAAAIEHGPIAPQARTFLRATDVGLRVAGTLDSPPAPAVAAARHTAQAPRSQARGAISPAQAERAPQAAAAGAGDASALAEEQYRMFKGFYLDSLKTVFNFNFDSLTEKNSVRPTRITSWSTRNGAILTSNARYSTGKINRRRVKLSKIDPEASDKRSSRLRSEIRDRRTRKGKKRAGRASQ